MKARVTITLDPEVHRKAKKAAKRKQTTVSGLIESLLLDEVSSAAEGDWVSGIVGSARLKDLKPGEDPLYDALVAKYVHE